MGILVDSSSCREIQRLLRLRGDRRLGVENSVTEKLLSLTEEATPGLRLKFLESRKRDLEGGTWIEYFALYKMKKWVETVQYLEYIFGCLSKLMGELHDLPIDSIGLQEVDYILSDGQSIRKTGEQEDSEETLGYNYGNDW